MVDPVVELLAKQSVARLREMDAQIEAQIADLSVQGTWVKRALAEKGQEVPPATTTNGVEPERVKRRRGSKRDAIIELMQTDPGRVWLPSQVRAGLLERNIDSTVEAIRVALRRMGDDHELERGDDGNGWKLASTNGAVQQPLEEAPSLEPEGYGR